MNRTQQIKAAQAGDHEAFLGLLAGCDRQIMAVVYRFTADLYDREDLYQEVFLHAFQSLSSFRGDSAFETWLYRITLNKCIQFMKKKPILKEAEEHGASDPDPVRKAQVFVVHRAMGRLQGPQRIAFFLHYIESWPLGEIASLLESSEGTIKSHLSRARNKVRQDREVLQWQMNAT